MLSSLNHGQNVAASCTATRHMIRFKLQALVDVILPPTTAVIGYALGLERLSANEQFFVEAQMAVSF